MDKLMNLLTDSSYRNDVGFIDLQPKSLYIAAASIAFNPIFWNIAARLEYKTKFLTRAFGSPYYGCYALAVTIFAIGIIRDHFYSSALDQQPIYPAIHYPTIGAILFGIGNVLVLSSMWALGVTGTYLGDYFGILMDDMVTGFPFNVTGSPMYWGSTLCFLGTALYKGRMAGIVLTAEVFIMYWFALKLEDPYTAHIYAKRDLQRVMDHKLGKTSKKTE